MKVLVCGDRHWKNYERLERVLDMCHKAFPITLIIEGEATGADTMARQWAEANNIPVSKHPADWAKYGRAAGPKRNAEMLAEGAEAVVAFHNDIDKSKGTLNMLRQAAKKNVKRILVTDNDLQINYLG